MKTRFAHICFILSCGMQLTNGFTLKRTNANADVMALGKSCSNKNIHPVITERRKSSLTMSYDDELTSKGNFESVQSFGYEGVPEEQRPATEYNNLRQQLLFNWASEESGDSGLLIRLGITYVALFALVCYPIAGATFTSDGYFLQTLLAANVGDMFVIMVLLIRLYSGWGYIGSRLKSKVVEFEETGWYDGSVEYKTKEEKARDLFLYKTDVEPVEARLKTVTLAAGGLLVASVLAFNVGMSIKPKFDEYDAAMLENLRADDKLAEVAARQSNGRPTYCDSRYYRAIANGGQGC